MVEAAEFHVTLIHIFMSPTTIGEKVVKNFVAFVINASHCDEPGITILYNKCKIGSF
jgi:hypothetical protein